MARELDIIIFGATGFIGKHVIPVVSKLSKTKNRHLTWGVAGRSEKKLRDLLDQYERDSGTSLSDVPVIIANVQDEKSLKEMARRARIIINCCGPYCFFGEPVVKACVEEGTHHVDTSGEPLFMETMQLKYHRLAQEKGAYVINACGVEGTPGDLGVVFLQKKFNGTLNSVVTYLEYWEEGEPLPGPAVNYGTWESGIQEMGRARELDAVRRQLFPDPLPNFKPKLQAKTAPHKSDVIEGWAMPYRGPGLSVMKRSQRNFHEDAKRPIQVETYWVEQSIWQILLRTIFDIIVLTLVKFQFGRNLLLKYPEKFTGGFFSHEPPSEEKIEKSHFSLTLYGEGWKEKLSDANDEYFTPPDKAICARVKGRNPGYGAACVCLVLAAITVITETDKMPSNGRVGGGVYTPGYAFAKTSLIEQLNENGVTFDVLFEKDLPSSK